MGCAGRGRDFQRNEDLTMEQPQNIGELSFIQKILGTQHVENFFAKELVAAMRPASKPLECAVYGAAREVPYESGRAVTPDVRGDAREVD